MAQKYDFSVKILFSRTPGTAQNRLPKTPMEFKINDSIMAAAAAIGY